MGQYEATIHWEGTNAADFASRTYGRAHHWTFDGGANVLASSSPHVVRLPFSDPAGVDPEEALVAALASCHMLFFLDLASRAGIIVTSYRDHAIGEMGKRQDGRDAMTKVTLRPEHALQTAVEASRIEALHEEAHRLCYIANSVNFPVVVVTSNSTAIAGNWS